MIANTAGAAGSAPADPAAGPAAAAALAGNSNDVAVGSGGVVYVANGNRVVRLDPQADGSYDLVRLVGTGAADTKVVPETGAVAATTGFGAVSHVAVAPDGRLYFVSVITDRVTAYSVFRLETDGTVTRVWVFSVVGAEIFDIAVAPSGALFMLRANGTSRFDAPVTASDTPVLVQSTAGTSPVTATPQPADATAFEPRAIAVVDDDTFYLGGGEPSSIGFAGVVEVDADQIATYAGGGQFNGLNPGLTPVSGTSGWFEATALALTGDGVLYTVRASRRDVLAITPPAQEGGTTMIQRVAGTGDAGVAAPGPALSSPVTSPGSVAADAATGALLIGAVPATGDATTVTYTPQVLRLVPRLPAVPGKPGAVAGLGSASVTVTPGAGGLEVESFTVTASPGGATCTIEATADPLSCTVTGLTAGTGYTFTATATGGGATSLTSVASDPVTPLARTAVTITAEAVTKVYGEPDPVLSYQVSGLASGDALTTLPTCTRAAGEDVGERVVTCEGAQAAEKYVISYVPGTLEITPALLTLSADDQTRLVGAPNPALTYTLNGLVDGETVEEVLGVEPQLETSATAASPVGEYPIEFTFESRAVEPRNYVVEFEPGTLTVTSADTDGDGLSDAREEQLGTDPRRADTDRDGLSDGVEVRGIRISARVYTGTGADEAGRVIGLVRTNPLRKDTDRDGLSDRREVRGTNVKQVVLAKGGRYTIGLRVTNPARADTDGDGLSDKQEVTGSANTKFDRARTDPNRADTDKSGMKDGTEIERGFNPVTL
ncbi:MBG domain-containing protein [Nocardioides sp.]|uniref:MBG domain-containing protein n=1 Tax=Nocardioides sp. TaxID=35761 RepID=UPI003516E260